MYEYNAVITNVVDGDTYDLDIDLGFHCHLHERVRVLGLDTPETRGTERQYGLIVKDWATRNLKDRAVVIHSRLEIAPKTDSFGRWLCDVVMEDGRTVTEILTGLGANKYDEEYSIDRVKAMAEDNNG